MMIILQMNNWRNAKEIMRRNAIRQKEKPSAQASHSNLCLVQYSLDYMTDYENNCEKITREDIKRFVSKYISGKPYVAGMIINPEMNKKLMHPKISNPLFNL